MKNDDFGVTRTNEAWLFGGVIGYDHYSPRRERINKLYPEHSTPGNNQTIVREAFPTNDLWKLKWDECVYTYINESLI